MAVLTRRTSITYRALHTRSKELVFFFFADFKLFDSFIFHDLLLAQNVIPLRFFVRSVS